MSQKPKLETLRATENWRDKEQDRPMTSEEIRKRKPSAAKSDFWKHYEHPLWQKKRLEIINRDGCTCTLCYDTETQLHIHHAYYIKGRKPWEYPDWSLSTRCKDCHKSDHDAPFESWETWETTLANLFGGASENEQYEAFELSTLISDGIKMGISQLQMLQSARDAVLKLIEENRSVS